MNIDLIIAFSISIPAITGVVFKKYQNPCFLPLIACLWLGLFNEGAIYVIRIYKNAPLFYGTANTYYLLESLLYLHFFYRCGIVGEAEKYKWVRAGILSFFVINMFFQNPLSHYLIYAYNLASLVFGILAVRLLAAQALDVSHYLWKNPLFFIGIGLLIVTVFSVFVESIRLINAGTPFFNESVFYIYKWINLTTYLLFTYAFICPDRMKNIS